MSTLPFVKNYLEEKINNSWYRNAKIDYGVTGKFVDAVSFGDGNDLLIIWEEENEMQIMPVFWYTEYTPEQIYNIWMEG